MPSSHCCKLHSVLICGQFKHNELIQPMLPTISPKQDSPMRFFSAVPRLPKACTCNSTLQRYGSTAALHDGALRKS